MICERIEMNWILETSGWRGFNRALALERAWSTCSFSALLYLFYILLDRSSLSFSIYLNWDFELMHIHSPMTLPAKLHSGILSLFKCSFERLLLGCIDFKNFVIFNATVPCQSCRWISFYLLHSFSVPTPCILALGQFTPQKLGMLDIYVWFRWSQMTMYGPYQRTM